MNRTDRRTIRAYRLKVYDDGRALAVVTWDDGTTERLDLSIEQDFQRFNELKDEFNRDPPEKKAMG